MILFHSINSAMEEKEFRSSVPKAKYIYRKNMLLNNNLLIVKKEMPGSKPFKK